MTSKVFGIGLSRTGTSTLVNALRILGYKSIHFPMTVQQFHDYDAAADTTVSMQFKVLDAQFPGSRFVYTTRDMESWLRSCERLWSRKKNVENLPPLIVKMRRKLYGGVNFDAARFADGYRRHDANIRQFFADRPDDLLVFDICGGKADWPALCDFLGKQVPALPFPWSNNGAKVDQLLIRALHVFGSVDKTIANLHVERGHMEQLQQSQAYTEHDPDEILFVDDGAQTSFLIGRLYHMCGGLDPLAEAYRLDPTSIVSSLTLLSSRLPDETFL
jgi:hypothetical protein